MPRGKIKVKEDRALCFAFVDPCPPPPPLLNANIGKVFICYIQREESLREREEKKVAIMALLTDGEGRWSGF
jgi:hypothetical protein